MIIGICGGSGSGKTSVLNGLKEHFSDLQPSIISLDNYYLPKEQQSKDENGKINFDLPTALNREKIFEDLCTLLNGGSVEIVEYAFNHTQTTKKIIVEPSELIIIEGLFVLTYKEIFDLLDFSIFVDVCEKIQLERRMERDMVARGYSKSDVLYQWENHVLPCYDKYIEPYKKHASLLILNDGTKKAMIEKVTETLDLHPKILTLKKRLLHQQ